MRQEAFQSPKTGATTHRASVLLLNFQLLRVSTDVKVQFAGLIPIFQLRRLIFIFHYFARAPWTNLRFQQGKEWPQSLRNPYSDFNIIITMSSIDLGT